MPRFLRFALAAAAAVGTWTVFAPAARADWPSPGAAADFLVSLAKGDRTVLTHFGAQTVLEALKFAALLVLFAVWVPSCDWVNRDRFYRRMSKNWNLAMVIPFSLLMILQMVLSLSRQGVMFLIVFPLMLMSYFIPFVTFVVKRNAVVKYENKVFTKKHIRYWTSKKLALVGIKVRSEEKTIDDMGPPLKFGPRGAPSEREDNINLLAARQAPGYLPAKELLAEALHNRADAIMLDYTVQAVAVRFQIDGVWHPGEGMEREPGDLMLAVLKTLCARNANERRARQQGVFDVEYEGLKRLCRFTSQGTQNGERVLMQFDDPAATKKRPLDLGMREKMFEEMKTILAERTGLVVISAPPGGGLTSLVHAVIGSMDRYTRGFVAVEDAAAREIDVENVPVQTFDAKQGQTPLTLLPKIVREYPDVLVVPDMKDAETVSFLCGQTNEDRMVITVTRAKEASEALLRMLAYKAPAAELASAMKLVVNMRLVRKLCDKCKEAYAPPPQLLQQLGIPPGRIEALYRPPTPNPEQPQEPCQQCRGIGFHGRIGMFEMMVVGDEVRQALQERPQLDAVRKAARKAGMRSLQEEGLLLVITGATSLPELLRVLKE